MNDSVKEALSQILEIKKDELTNIDGNILHTQQRLDSFLDEKDKLIKTIAELEEALGIKTD